MSFCGKVGQDMPMPLLCENRHRDFNHLSSGGRGRQGMVGSLNFESPLHRSSINF